MKLFEMSKLFTVYSAVLSQTGSRQLTLNSWLGFLVNKTVFIHELTRCLRCLLERCHKLSDGTSPPSALCLSLANI